MMRALCSLAGLGCIVYALASVALPLGIAFVGVALLVYGESE
jgi:hypothetical protein